VEGAVEGGIGDWDEVVTRWPYRKVRLDHLLSKEHLAVLRDRPEPVSDVHADLVLMGGTLTSSAVASRRLP
jgi:hypothetical protein